MENDNSDASPSEPAPKKPGGVSGETQSDSHAEPEKLDSKVPLGSPGSSANQAKLPSGPGVNDPALTKPRASESHGGTEPSPAPKMPQGVDVASATRVEPQPAPVTSLPEIAKAGVRLTEFVLVLIGLFLAVSLVLIATGEANATSRANRQLEILVGACTQDITASRAQGDRIPSASKAPASESLAAPVSSTDSVTSTPKKADGEKSTGANECKLDAETTRAILTQANAELVAFRLFALDLLKTVLLNVLLPVLTALLGYVFGSSRGTS